MKIWKDFVQVLSYGGLGARAPQKNPGAPTHTHKKIMLNVNQMDKGTLVLPHPTKSKLPHPTQSKHPRAPLENPNYTPLSSWSWK